MNPCHITTFWLSLSLPCTHFFRKTRYKTGESTVVFSWFHLLLWCGVECAVFGKGQAARKAAITCARPGSAADMQWNGTEHVSG
jgi:hypothetical protein